MALVVYSWQNPVLQTLKKMIVFQKSYFSYTYFYAFAYHDKHNLTIFAYYKNQRVMFAA